MVFQSYALYPHMSVARNMGFGLKMRGVPAAESRDRVRAAARLLGLDELLERYPSQLSGGQKQRVALGPSHRAQTGGVPAGRTALQPGCPTSDRDPDRAAETATSIERHLHPGDPRPGGGDDAGGRHRRDEGRDAATNGAAGGDLRQTGQPCSWPGSSAPRP